MDNCEKTYFELKDSGEFIRIELMNLSPPNDENDWDRNWVKSKVIVKAGGFSGMFYCDLMTTDFDKFYQEFSQLYDKLDGTASFDTIEGQVELKINGDGIGHFLADCCVMDYAGTGNKLDFKIDFDQSIIPEMCRQLENITKTFPVRED